MTTVSATRGSLAGKVRGTAADIRRESSVEGYTIIDARGWMLGLRASLLDGFGTNRRKKTSRGDADGDLRDARTTEFESAVSELDNICVWISFAIQ